MTSTVTLYTKSLTKRPDITGTKDQAFGHKKNFLNYLVGAIKAKTVAVIGMVALGNLIIVRLYIISCTSSMVHVSSLSELNLVQTLNR